MQELLVKEQQEEQLLRDITGVQRLQDVTFLDAVVDCTETSLSSLGEKMPLLRELKLNNSALSSVRDLGSKLRHLQVLWVSHCGLTGLDGLNALPSLKELYAAFNHIDNLEPFADMETLAVLDLEGNKVDDLGALQYLAWCPQLAVLTLADNPIAADPTYQAQACKAVPKLQVLDDTRLGHPMSPLTKPMPATNHSLHAADSQHASAAASPTLWPSMNIDASSRAAAFSPSSSSDLLSLDSAGMLLGRPHVRQGKMQRPASASRLQQRLPPVAAGHNQPGSFLLYSLSHLPSDALATALAQQGPHSPGPTSGQASRSSTNSPCVQSHSRAASLVQDWASDNACSMVDADDEEDDEQHCGGSRSAANPTRRVRPQSAGIRRAESRLDNPFPAESSRPASAEGDVSTSEHAESAGLYWRKHRLVNPAGYTMTEEEAQAAVVDPTAPMQLDAAPDSRIETVTDCRIDAVTEAVTEDVSDSSVIDCSLGSEACSSSASAHLVIEDAAELTHDRAAAILRQLSHECQAAGTNRASFSHISSHMEATGWRQPLGDADVQQLVSDADVQQPLPTLQTAAASPAAPTAVAAHADSTASSAASALMSYPAMHAQSGSEESGCLLAAQAASTLLHQRFGHTVDSDVDYHMHASTASTSHVTGDMSDQLSHQDLICPTSVQHPSQSGDGVQQGGQPLQGPTSAAASVPQQSAPESLFLQRLRMSKQAGCSNSASVAPRPVVSMQDQAELAPVARPPSPERPPTPSSRPARRRHLIPAALQDSSPPVSPSWAGPNRKFAPMPQQMSWDPAHASLPVRPASAGVAESQHQAGSEMSWTGSMQLPAGLLKLTARSQPLNAGRKGKHQYDWGFGNAKGLV